MRGLRSADRLPPEVKTFGRDADAKPRPMESGSTSSVDRHENGNGSGAASTASERSRQATLIHELQGALTSIGGFADLVSEQFADKLGEQGSDWLARVHRGVGRAQELADELRGEQEPVEPEAPQEAAPADDAERIRVVVADDDDDIRALIGEYVSRDPSLELVGSACDTGDAVRVVGELEPDVAIVDWMMPGGGGGVATGQIKANNPETKVIGFTGGDPNQASYDMMTAGAVSFLRKPCTKDELLEAIHGSLRW
jgi:CheY-like chemotaxis protein